MPRLRASKQSFRGDRSTAGLADSVRASRQSLLSGVQLGQRLLGPAKQGGVAGLVQGDRGALGIMLVVGQGQTADVPHLFDRRHQGRPLAFRLSHPLAEQLGVAGIGVRHLLILRLATNANTLDQ